MLIICKGCEAKIRVPDSAAGKRAKCPKCATVIRIPEAPEKPAADPEAAAVSEKPLPPPIPMDPDESDDTEVAAAPPKSSVKKPPPIKAKRASGAAEDTDDEDDDPAPPRSRRRRYDDDDEDEDDDEDAADFRRRTRRVGKQPVNSLATASMITGIVSVSFAGIGLCCCTVILEPLAVVSGIVAIILGFMGRTTPGSESHALTGIICGSVSVVLALVGFVIIVCWIGFNVANMGNGF